MQMRLGRFTGPLLLLAFLVVSSPLGNARPQQPSPTQTERDRLVQKVREVNRWGPEAQIVSDVAGELDKLIADGIDAEIQFGWGLTKDGMAYRLNWKKSTFSFDALSEADAGKAGFKRMSMSVMRLAGAKGKPAVEKLSRGEAFARGLPYHISEVPGQAPLTLAPEQKVSLRMRMARGQAAAPSAALEVRYRFSGGNQTLYSYPEFPAAGSEKEISHEMGWDKNLAGQDELQCIVTVVSTPQVAGGQVRTNPLSNSLLFTVRLGSK